jgi:pimeloyl-ACP methyl ester carboxylesterase
MTKETTTSGLRLRYDDHGDGRVAVLCLPGWCIPRTMFSRFAQELAERAPVRVLALDWRSHGESEQATHDFGAAQLADDAQAVIAASGAGTVVPLAQAHAGWVALELKRRLGPALPGFVFASWPPFDPPPPFTSALEALQDRKRWEDAREQLLSLWLHQTPSDVAEPLRSEVRRASGDMWARAGREIAAAYAVHGSPLRALKAMGASTPVLHLFAQPRSPELIAAHSAIAAEHPWFHFERVEATSHFPTLETPKLAANAVADFLARELL